MRRLLMLFVPILLLFAGCSGDQIEIDYTEDESSSLSDPGLAWSESSCKASLGVSNTFPTLSNENGLSVSYSSSLESVATIDDSGSVTLVGEGSTVISASSEETDVYEAGSVSYTLVVSKSESGLSWSAEDASVVIGSEYSLPELSNPNSLTVSYASSDEEVATIDDSGSVTIISDGSTTITASAEETDYFEAGSVSYTLTVTKSSDGISWSTSSCTVTIGASDNTYPTLNNPGSQTVSYSSSNTSVATISSDGSITLVTAGATTITAVSEENDNYESATASYTLTVQAEGSNLKSAGLAWPATEYSVTIGSSFTSPSLTNPYGLTVTYASSDTGVATVDSNGSVTIVAAGTTTITATSEATDTYSAGSAHYTLTVSKASAGLSWSSSAYTATLKSSNSYPTLSNENGLSVSYTSSDTSVATIDSSSGEISLVASGSTTITASYS
ncbi:MAG: Ig-like domain-containing protein, partial [Bacteroidales bacterium]|nr:Ig-like domain-containing protein [Bacteroidales bacterium]